MYTCLHAGPLAYRPQMEGQGHAFFPRTSKRFVRCTNRKANRPTVRIGAPACYLILDPQGIPTPSTDTRATCCSSLA